MLRNVFKQSLNSKRNFEKISSGSWFSVHVLSFMDLENTNFPA